ncbi:MAG: hypothetical protein IT580_12480 [Verrucomicrobiales bacterium]|nr:hypothetical protein [Verrucomicrobiales bacterium]
MKTTSRLEPVLKPSCLARWLGAVTVSCACAGAFLSPAVLAEPQVLGVVADPASPPSPSPAAGEAEDDDPAESVKRVVRSALRDAERAMSEAARVGHQVAVSFHRGGAPSAVVLPSDDMKPEAADALTEDLMVMSRILQKALRTPENERNVFGSWVGVEMGRWGGFGRGIDALYLDGFGALFLLSVDFPLVKPAEAEVKADPAEVDETWERARRELRGAPRTGGSFFGDAEFGASPDEQRQFEATRVEELTERVIDTLRHASNLKGLREEETVAVTVFGPASEGGGKVKGRRGERGSGRGGAAAAAGGGAGGVYGLMTGAEEGVGPRRGSVLTFRVKKAVVVEFAAGKLSREEFVRRVQVSAR